MKSTTKAVTGGALKNTGKKTKEPERYLIKTIAIFFIALISSPFLSTAAYGREFACADYTSGKVCLVNSEGKITWEYKAQGCNDLWVLANGNLLFSARNKVLEVAPDKTVVFSYAPAYKCEIYSCQRLADGNTLVGECVPGQLVILDPKGQVVKQINIVPRSQTANHTFFRKARMLPTGNFLVAMYGLNKVCEFTPEGKIVFEVFIPGGPHTAIRLPNGNTLISSGGPALTEVDPQGKTVWQLSNADLSNSTFGADPLKFLAGFHRLPNGNTVIANYQGQFLGKLKHNPDLVLPPQLFEITPDKKIVWHFSNYPDFQTISNVQILGEGIGFDGLMH